ncbi:MAG: Butyrate--acetoacetate CoA-transferase subunit B [Firmicutes bacterium]|nr:Butyrate--acetoacetate CoA-transferase subunit B [Bacillota bacterium]MDI6705331.1 3-oxoacid CoA-transferase subunit B [Bacillota bacterium]
MNIIPEAEAKIRIAKRIARKFSESSKKIIINLGVGIPTMVADYIEGGNVCVQAENGMLGVGPVAPEGMADRQLINAGRQPVTETRGCCYFDSSISFGMIRGGHIDATVIGAFEVSKTGDIANWVIPNGKQLGVGGAMDLVSGAKEVIVAMTHTTKDGKPKLVKNCSLPVTGIGEADMVVTELAVFCFEDGEMVLKEIAPEASLDLIRSLTEAEFKVDANLKTMEV